MTSFAGEYNNLFECSVMVISLENTLRRAGINISRTKVECGISLFEKYEDFVLYAESHFNMMGIAAAYPVSVNINHPEKRMGLDRIMKPSETELYKFKDKWKYQTVELCLLDSNVGIDDEWFDSWETKYE